MRSASPKRWLQRPTAPDNTTPYDTTHTKRQNDWDEPITRTQSHTTNTTTIFTHITMVNIPFRRAIRLPSLPQTFLRVRVKLWQTHTFSNKIKTFRSVHVPQPTRRSHQRIDRMTTTQITQRSNAQRWSVKHRGRRFQPMTHRSSLCHRKNHLTAAVMMSTHFFAVLTSPFPRSFEEQRSGSNNDRPDLMPCG